VVSKGVDYYLYFGSDDLNANVAVPKIDRRHSGEANFHRNNMQIQSSNIRGIFNYTGRLEWVARRGSTEAARQWQDVNTLTGNLGNGTMKNMFATPPRLGNPTVCWGFYDAGNGNSGLSNQHQLYIYVTRDQRRWMSDLVARKPEVAQAPFARFALPGSHDAGMCTMATVMDIFNSPGGIAAMLGAAAFIPLIGPILAGVGRGFAPRAIANLAMTQKDDIRAMLDSGTRYFDYRPGLMHSSLLGFARGVRYHQHGVIPGYPYVAFLEDLLRWLDANPGEIVVVNANVQGMAEDRMKPSAADVWADFLTARGNVRLPRPVNTGDKQHLTRTYAELIRDNIRLIFLNQIEGETRKYDSWTGDDYATVTPGPIIRRFEAMHPTPPDGQDYIVLQMQATSTNIRAVAAASAVTTSDASSPLLATKAVMDAATNPWLRANGGRFSHEHPLVLLNDFVDNCMVDTAIQLTEARVARG